MSRSKFFLLFLLVLPWLLAVAFLLSFYWDFNHYSLQIGSISYPLQGVLRYVSISGLIGFFTNWIAIQMLFYPRKRRPLLGQGLIPAQKEKIADRLAVAVERDFLNVETLKKKLLTPPKVRSYAKKLIHLSTNYLTDREVRTGLQSYVNEYIKELLSDPNVQSRIKVNAERIINENLESKKLEKTALKLYLLIKGKQLRPLLDEIVTEMPNKVNKLEIPYDQLVSKLPEKLETDIDKLERLIVRLFEEGIQLVNIREIIQQNLQEYDELKLEQIIRNASDTQLNYIKYLGAFIGMFGGLIIWNPIISLSLLGLIAILVISIDLFLVHFK